MKPSIDTKVAQSFHPVKPADSHQENPFLRPLRHHSNASPHIIIGNREKIWKATAYYGVSPSYRILTKGLYLKRFHHVRQFLKDVLGLTTAQREVVLRLLRYWTYYGKVYPKIADVCSDPGCSKATAWRTIAVLEERGLVKVINRILKPSRRQISNLFILHNLLLFIAKYLAEKSGQLRDRWLEPYILLSWPQLWERVRKTPEARAGPIVTMS